MKITLCSDIHLNFLLQEEVKKFCSNLCAVAKTNKSDYVFICGDISEAPQVSKHLQVLLSHFQTNLPGCKVRFVLGNHDFYRGSITGVRSSVQELFPENYLHTSPIAEKTDNSETLIVGADGWYDGLYGDWFSDQTVRMADYDYIEELKICFWQKELNARLIEEAEKSALLVKTKVMGSVIPEQTKKVIIVTHTPPFIQNSVHAPKGKGSEVPSNKFWLPNFSSKTMGDTLLELANLYPSINFTCFCGHSHGSATYSPTSNLVCHTLYSDYGMPQKSLINFEV